MDDTKRANALGLLAFGRALVIASMVLNAWALRLLWGWFVVPVSGLPGLALVQAVGISCLVRLLLLGAINAPDVTEEGWPTAIAEAFVPPLVFTGIGWMIVQFM